MVFQKINQRDCKLLAGGIVLGIIFMGVVVGVNYSLFRTQEIVLPKIETTVPTPTTTTTTTTTVPTSEEGKFASNIYKYLLEVVIILDQIFFPRPVPLWHNSQQSSSTSNCRWTRSWSEWNTMASWTCISTLGQFYFLWWYNHWPLHYTHCSTLLGTRWSC